LTRRSLLLSLPAVAAARRLMAQSGPSSIRVKALNHVGLAVTDPKRTIEFYQGLFGMPVQARQGATALLRIGSGPQFLAVSPVGANQTPSLTHYCLSVDGFNVDAILKTLAAHGVTKADEAGTTGAGQGSGGSLSGGPMKVRVRMRGPDAGGAKGGTPEIYVGDQDGIVVQLQDAKYCGGSGSLGESCAATEPAPKRGLLTLSDLSHVTIFAADGARSNKFYQDLFGLSIRSYQGPTAPTLAVGPDVQFVMFAGGGGGARGGGATPAPARQASINHLCMNMRSFSPDPILKTLETFGIKPRESAQGPAGPMRSYVSMRMENRGGAKEGTPELYFTDPDGLLMQLQDTSYCGGAGVLGNICPPIS